MQSWKRSVMILLCVFVVCASQAYAQVQVYEVAISGTTGFSGAGVPSAQFVHQGTLVLTPTINPAPALNDVNPVDVGIFTTSASPLVGQAGALWFGTNTALAQQVGVRAGGVGVDIAFVDFEAATNQLFIAVDGNAFGLPAARLNAFNIFNVTTGLAAQIHNVLAGMIQMQFSADFSTVSGTISLGGNSGFAGPAVTSEYQAQFMGRRIQ